MRPSLPAAAALCVLALVAAARAETATPGAGASPPRFEDFPAGPAYAGRVRLALGRADMAFRTRLREAAEGRPNFAGHYVLALWGCGAGCVMGAAIDARSGKVTWLPGTTCCWDAGSSGSGPGSGPGSSPGGAPWEFEPVRYRLDSRLLVLAGRRNERDGDDGEHYYRIEGDRFLHLRDVPPVPRRQGAATAARARTAPVTADASGRLSWVAWETGQREGRSVHLGLLRPRSAHLPPPVASWDGAFAPVLRQPSGWSFSGRPVVALTMHFGAAAEAVALLSLDARQRPVRLGEDLADSLEWRADAAGRAVLVLLSRRDTAEEVPSCRAWDGRRLQASACP